MSAFRRTCHTRPERYRSGRNGGASKASCRVTGTWVRIPPSPPLTRSRSFVSSRVSSRWLRLAPHLHRIPPSPPDFARAPRELRLGRRSAPAIPGSEPSASEVCPAEARSAKADESHPLRQTYLRRAGSLAGPDNLLSYTLNTAHRHCARLSDNGGQRCQISRPPASDTRRVGCIPRLAARTRSGVSVVFWREIHAFADANGNGRCETDDDACWASELFPPWRDMATARLACVSVGEG